MVHPERFFFDRMATESSKPPCPCKYRWYFVPVRTVKFGDVTSHFSANTMELGHVLLEGFLATSIIAIRVGSIVFSLEMRGFNNSYYPKIHAYYEDDVIFNLGTVPLKDAHSTRTTFFTNIIDILSVEDPIRKTALIDCLVETATEIGANKVDINDDGNLADNGIGGGDGTWANQSWHEFLSPTKKEED